jgi:hypothetical protein
VKRIRLIQVAFELDMTRPDAKSGEAEIRERVGVATGPLVER